MVSCDHHLKVLYKSGKLSSSRKQIDCDCVVLCPKCNLRSTRFPNIVRPFFLLGYADTARSMMRGNTVAIEEALRLFFDGHI